MKTDESKASTGTAVAKAAPPMSERFTALVMREFNSATGDAMQLTADQRRLAQHLFLAIDASLKALEAKRLQSQNPDAKAPITWPNINMPKLAVDAMYRIDLGLDALIPNHISAIPYWNTRESRYDLDLRVGYVGKDYYKRRFALVPPVSVIYELVYDTDNFKVLKRDSSRAIETYEFQITAPFNRGEIVGGFAYLMYADQSRNHVVLVSEKEFKRSESLAQSKEFWTKNPIEMRFKTLVNRVTSRMWVDPQKMTTSYAAVEAAEEAADEAEAQAIIDAGMLKDGPVTLQDPEAQDDPGPTEEGQATEPPPATVAEVQESQAAAKAAPATAKAPPAKTAPAKTEAKSKAQQAKAPF